MFQLQYYGKELETKSIKSSFPFSQSLEFILKGILKAINSWTLLKWNTFLIFLLGPRKGSIEHVWALGWSLKGCSKWVSLYWQLSWVHFFLLHWVARSYPIFSAWLLLVISQYSCSRKVQPFSPPSFSRWRVSQKVEVDGILFPWLLRNPVADACHAWGVQEGKVRLLPQN